MKILLAILLANTLNLSFEYKESNPYSLFPYNCAVSDTNTLGFLSNPAYLPLWEAAYINLDYAKPYMMNELNSGNLRAGFSFSNAAIQAAWNRFGIKEYSEDVLEGNCGYRPWKFLSAGLGISYFHLNINTEDIKYSHETTDFKFSILLLPCEWINLGYYQENIYSLINGKNSEEDSEEDFLFPGRSFGIALKVADGAWLTWNLNKVYYGYVNSFSVSANLLSCLSLKGGYSRETSSCSFSVNFMYGRFSVLYGMAHHTYLGTTHKLGLTIASADFSLEEISYNKKLERRSLPEKKKKININKCSLEELTESGLFADEIAQRIMKYRDTIGPVSGKALQQIGLTKKEFDNIKDCISGLTDESDSKKQQKSANKYKRAYKKSGYDVDTRKQLFQRLLENGINAGTALKAADLAKYNSKDRLIKIIRESPDIDQEKKKIIIKICADFL